jgi:hypothetical protein
MRLLFTALVCLLSVSISAQEQVITYPYNPDVDADNLISIPDLLELLIVYGNEFFPEPVTVDGVTLTEWLEQNSNSSTETVEIREYTINFNALTLHDTILIYDIVGEALSRVSIEIMQVDWTSPNDQDVIVSLEAIGLNWTSNFGQIELRGNFDGSTFIYRWPRNSSSIFTKTIGKLMVSGESPYIIVSPYSYNGDGGSGSMTIRVESLFQ